MLIEKNMNLKRLAGEIVPNRSSLNPQQRLLAAKYASELLQKFSGLDTNQVPLGNFRSIAEASIKHALASAREA